MVEVELPVKVNPHTDESGLGYCLRAAAANGTTISALHRLLNIGATERLGRQHSVRLSRILGCNEAWLARSLADRSGRRGSTSLVIYQYAFRSRTALRLRTPQLCERCLMEQDYIHSAWDLSLYTVCVRHQVELASICRHCKRNLSWSRPAPDWCTCGRFLGSKEAIASEDHPLILANQMMLRSFSGSFNVEALRIAGLFDWLNLSPSGWHDLLMGLGLVERRFVQPPREAYLTAPSSVNARTIASRGMRRLLSWSQGELEPQQLATTTSTPFLRGLVEMPGSPTDRQVGLRIFHLLFGKAD